MALVDNHATDAYGRPWPTVVPRETWECPRCGEHWTIAAADDAAWVRAFVNWQGCPCNQTPQPASGPPRDRAEDHTSGVVRSGAAPLSDSRAAPGT